MIRSPLAKPGRFWRRTCIAFSPEEVARRCLAKGWRFPCQQARFMEDFGHPITDTTAIRTGCFTTARRRTARARAFMSAVHFPAILCQPERQLLAEMAFWDHSISGPFARRGARRARRGSLTGICRDGRALPGADARPAMLAFTMLAMRGSDL